VAATGRGIAAVIVAVIVAVTGLSRGIAAAIVAVTGLSREIAAVTGLSREIGAATALRPAIAGAVAADRTPVRAGNPGRHAASRLAWMAWAAAART
jgi:hypothetical protein